MGGAPALPTPSTPGYTSFRGRTACVCLAQWLPVYEALLLAKGLIKQSIDIWQLTGGAPASGGTHTKGGVFDVFQIGPAYVAVAREMGAPATWSRTVSQGFTKAHTHGVLTGCPHNDPAAYQITAQKRGYDGLGKPTTGPYAGQWGYGAKDEFPKPSTYRTWQQGITWAKTEIARLTKEDDMQLNDPVKLNTNIEGVAYSSPNSTVGGLLTGTFGYVLQTRNQLNAALAAQQAQLAALTAAVQTLAQSKGIDPAVVETIIRDSVKDALDNLRIVATPPATP